MNKILVINCGSSSLKYEVYQMPERESLGKGVAERIGLKEGFITQENKHGEYTLEAPIPNHKKAMEMVLAALMAPDKGIIKDKSEIKAVGHRVVHGGEEYAESVIIDDKVIESIDNNSVLAPLHNPPNLTGIQEAMNVFPGVKHVAVFDTAYHQTIPPAGYLYGLPRELYDKYKIRRYGFHGTSHRYVANEALKILQRSSENTNVISCHLGNGASITAIEKGCSVDTSMGFTPLEGLLMGTRSGDMDPAIIPFLMDKGYTSEEINTMLNKKSGLLGLSTISSDMRDITAAADEGNKNAEEALEVYAYRIRKYIGSYAAILVKVDAIVFTGGIGRYQVNMRKRICQRLENLGIVIDYNKNVHVGNGCGIISKDYSPTAILVIPTNEELQIAQDSYDLVF